MNAFSLASLSAWFQKQLIKIIAVVVVFAAGAVTSGFVVHDHYIKKIAATEAMDKALIENAQTQFKDENVLVVTKLKIQYRDRIIWKDRLIDRIEEVKNEDDKTCTLGPAFVRLHNDAARALPATGPRVDATSTSTRPTGP
jgi:hypothetical protein